MCILIEGYNYRKCQQAQFSLNSSWNDGLECHSGPSPWNTVEFEQNHLIRFYWGLSKVIVTSFDFFSIFFFYLNGCHSKCLIIHSLLYWWALCLFSLFGNNSVAFGCLAVRSFFNIFKGLVDLVGASLSVCVCVCLLFALLKAWITLFESQVPIDSVWVVLPWVNFLCVKEMSSIHWPALWSLDYWANICVDVCAACLEGSCVFVSVFAFQSCVYVCRCLF